MSFLCVRIHAPLSDLYIDSVMAVGTGFGQLFRGIGQVGGVGIASSIFQSLLDKELSKRIHGPDAEEIIKNIRHSSKLVATLPPGLQEHARESYAIALRAVFTFAAAATLTAYIVRLPVRCYSSYLKDLHVDLQPSRYPRSPLTIPARKLHASPACTSVTTILTIVQMTKL